jgi:hypothetical protein
MQYLHGDANTDTSQAVVLTIVDYDSLVSNPLATCYVAKFIYKTGLLTQFQHIEQEEDDIEPDDPAVTEYGPEDARY